MKAHDNQKFLKILCDSLKFLAKRDNETKRKILEKGGTHRVIGKDERNHSLLDNAPNYLVGCVIQKRSIIIFIFHRLR